MTIKRKTNITLLIFGALSLLLIFLVISPLFNQIKSESSNLIAQKNKLAESEVKIKNIQDFEVSFKQYQPNLEKINELFIDISEPIGFIKFLEQEATSSQLSIEIAPPVLKEEKDAPWRSLEFSLNLEGSAPKFLRFLDRLESSPYLVEPLNLSIRKISDINNTIAAILLIKVYAK